MRTLIILWFSLGLCLGVCLLLTACGEVESDDQEASRICRTVSGAAYGQCQAMVLNRISGQRHESEEVAAMMMFRR